MLRPVLVAALLLSAGVASAASPSPLASADRKTLVETALRELVGQGNAAQTLPDGKIRVTTALTAADQEVLVRQVFGPFLWDAEKRQMLERAACQRYLRRSQILWTKTVAEALEEKACDIRLEPRDLYTNPAVKLALADALLVDHPQRQELLAQMRLAISRTIGAKPHAICYGLQPTDAPAVDDAACRVDWGERGVDAFTHFAAFSFEPVSLEQWSLEDIHDAWAALAGVTTKDANSDAGILKTAFQARLAKRDSTVAAHRAKLPATVRAVDVAAALPKHSTYLWHEACAEPKRTVIQDDAGASEAEVVCVKYAFLQPTKGGCFEETANFVRRLGGTTHAKGDVVTAAQPVECP